MANHKKMVQTSIKKNYIYNTIYQVLSLITPLITAPYISRVLGSNGVGIYSYTNSIVTYFTLFAALGTASYGQRLSINPLPVMIQKHLLSCFGKLKFFHLRLQQYH